MSKDSEDRDSSAQGPPGELVTAVLALSEEPGLEPLLLRLLRLATASTGADRAHVLLRDEDSGALQLHASLGPEGARVLQPVALEECDALPVSLLGAVARNQTPVSSPQDAPHLPPRAFAALPLVTRGQLAGVLYLEHPGTFPPARLEALQRLCAHVALALHRARLDAALEQRTQQLRATQRQLIAQEKLASLGALTAGIAHELRNPLNFVINFAEGSQELAGELAETLARAGDLLPPDSRSRGDEALALLRQNLDKIAEHGRRTSEIINAMMLHARQAPDTRERVDLNAVLAGSLRLARHGAQARESGAHIHIETEYGEDVGMADLLAQELGRVFINLVGNAFYAMREKRRALGPAYQPVLRASTWGDAEHVGVTLRDNGTGIPRGLLDRIFTPFFTTKPQGEGTGLGLPICHDIVTRLHGGTLEVDTVPGQYTEFRITLPRRARGVAPTLPASPQAS